MIASFADKATRDVFDGTDSKEARSIPKQLWSVAVRKLDMLDAAQEIGDLRAPPANRLERLKGDLAGLWSIRVNDQYRIVFQFADGKAAQVRIMDYH
ncbi:MAG TPA: type II toxin-antitoxin system RelE/ParE family toxin [Myxococcales bacterium]|jgi:proteic killer suppression protein|nr:type II toxin-antitoxin system RelE/ParE family toxin [Myxococcales bacterium]